MKSVQLKTKTTFTEADIQKLHEINPSLFLIFGAPRFFELGSSQIEAISKIFPSVCMIGCSTAGEIGKDGVSDDSLVLTALNFADASLKAHSVKLKSAAESKEAGSDLAKGIPQENLKGIFLLCKGLDADATRIIQGIQEVFGPNIQITGGLAGDGLQFANTFTVVNGRIATDELVALGFYGKISLGYGYAGGWEPFGLVRVITKAVGNRVFEIDGKPALALYKEFLGSKSVDLPGSGLLYPFSVLKDRAAKEGIIRTILAVDEAEQSIILAGDIPTGSLVKLMHGSNEGLTKGARAACSQAIKNLTRNSPESNHAILVSCVGRKMMMGGDIEDEIDAIREELPQSSFSGFYSYGEICPVEKIADCKLHNQTMTVTLICDEG